MLPGPEEEAQTSDQVKDFLGISVPVIPSSSSWLESVFSLFLPSFISPGSSRDPLVYFHDFNEILTQTNDKIWQFDLTVGGTFSGSSGSADRRN